MNIPFVTRSRFLSPCEAIIRSGSAALDAGGSVRIQFDESGYEGKVSINIRPLDTAHFETDWQGDDATRFPARIRAAATALLNCKFVGDYVISHSDGLIEIRKA